MPMRFVVNVTGQCRRRSRTRSMTVRPPRFSTQSFMSDGITGCSCRSLSVVYKVQDSFCINVVGALSTIQRRPRALRILRPPHSVVHPPSPSRSHLWLLSVSGCAPPSRCSPPLQHWLLLVCSSSGNPLRQFRSRNATRTPQLHTTRVRATASLLPRLPGTVVRTVKRTRPSTPSLQVVTASLFNFVSFWVSTGMETEGADISCEGFVGFDPTLKTVVVSIQGTAPSAMYAIIHRSYNCVSVLTTAC